METEIDIGAELANAPETLNDKRAIGYFKVAALAALASMEQCTVQEFVIMPEYRVLVNILKVNIGEKRALKVIEEFLNANLYLFEIE